MEPIERLDSDAARLMAEYPPAFDHPNKRLVLEIACPPGAPVGGRIAYSRWSAQPLPARIARPAPGRIASHPGWYSYRQLPGSDPSPGIVEWHVNFADAELFGYYAGPLFAQDEAQVAEHPVLASVREALLARGRPARTEEGGRATPVLVRGVERRVAIETAPDPAARAEGLYGRRFATAPPAVVARATRRLDPPTLTNVLAMAAPAGGRGPYRADEVQTILATAHSGFRAAVAESVGPAGGSGAWVHTGFWGCGAFGGDRELLALLQLVAAASAGLDRLVFWTGSAGGEAPLRAALAALDELVPPQGMATAELVARIVARGYRWRGGDGT